MEQELPNKDNEYIIAKYHFYEDGVNCFEEYEKAVNTKQLDYISKCQNDCIHFINEIIKDENSEPYFTALFCIRNDLLNQRQQTEILKDQITINEITIIRTCNPVPEPMPNLFSSNLKPIDTNVEPEIKKQKCTDNDNAKKLQNIIENTLVVPQTLGLSDIAGLKSAKSLLRQAILFPMQYPHLFTEGRKKWNKALLYGPPGTGKTQLAHCLATEIKSRLYSVSNSDLLSCYVGESEKLIKTLFQYCQENKENSLIFVDEIDSICRIRNSKESEYERRFKNQLLTQLSEIDRSSSNKIFFLACTNCPWDLDPAFIRRFQQRIYISLPDRETRLEILKLQSKSTTLMNSQWNQILDKTEGWSGSDITDLVNFAMLQPIKDLENATKWIMTKDNQFMPVKESKHSTLKLKINDIPSNKVAVRPVEFSDFILAFNHVTKTVSKETLLKFEKFNESFGTLQTKKINN